MKLENNDKNKNVLHGTPCNSELLRKQMCLGDGLQILARGLLDEVLRLLNDVGYLCFACAVFFLNFVSFFHGPPPRGLRSPPSSRRLRH